MSLMRSKLTPKPGPQRVEKQTRPTRRSPRLAKLANTITSREVRRLPSPPSDSYPRAAKRKRDGDTAQPEEEGLPSKRQRPTRLITPTSTGADYVDWKAVLGEWPPIHEQKSSMSRPDSNKRSRSSSSYSQRVREGSSPAQWTRRHAEQMQEAGVVMGEYAHLAKLDDGCQRMCKELLKKSYLIPKDSSFEVNQLTRTLDRVQFRNETRVIRDVMPILVPSPELLCFSGNNELAYISETLDALWRQCDLLGGPMPKPDMAVGISPSAFSSEEKNKLTMSHTSACPNLFPENMYLPFLICEAKQSDRAMEEAERQAMHSASIVVRAIIRLYQKTSFMHEVDQRILVFSVAHNHSTVKVFGHFAKLDGDKMTFFRHRVFSQEFAAEVSSGGWTKAYQISRAIYDDFYPQHLARIKKALSEMRDPTIASFTSRLELDGNPQGSTAESSSQEQDRFKEPSVPASVKLQRENKELRDRLLDIVRQMAQQKEQMERQMAQQKEESREQKEQMERQMAQQKEQMERQMAQQREDLAEQKALMKSQQAELMRVLGDLKPK